MSLWQAYVYGSLRDRFVSKKKKKLWLVIIAQANENKFQCSESQAYLTNTLKYTQRIKRPQRERKSEHKRKSNKEQNRLREKKSILIRTSD